jgi:hypothetical protein
MDGKPVRLADLKGGDMLTATIVTSAPPEVLTAKDVQAVLDIPEPTPAEVAAAEPAPAPAAASAAAPAAAAAEPAAAEAAAPATGTPEITATQEPVKTEEKPDRKWIWIVLGLIIVIGAYLLMRKKKTEA